LAVPDNDRFARRLPRGWSKVARCLDSDRAADAGSAIEQALVELLKSTGGVPGLDVLADWVERHFGGQGRLDIAVDDVPHLPPETNENTRLAWSRAKALAAAAPDGISSTDALSFTTEFVTDLVRRYGEDRILPLRIGGGQCTLAEAKARMASALEFARVTDIARQLLARPSAATLRTPGHKRVPTVEVLHVGFSQLDDLS
jgi:hypothetical protein